MKLLNTILLLSFLSTQIFANDPVIKGNVICKIQSEKSAECFQMTQEGNIDYSQSIKDNGLELAMALLEAGGQDEHGMGSTYISAYHVECVSQNSSLQCSINE